jgi:hypothetical protein
VNIQLNNIPYVTQRIPNNQKSKYYCGLASALMVRGKNIVGYPAQPVPNYADNMIKMDNYLLNSNMYGYSSHMYNGWIGYP